MQARLTDFRELTAREITGFDCSVIACWTPFLPTLIARFMGPTCGPSGADRTQVGHMLAPWTLLSGYPFCEHFSPNHSNSLDPIHGGQFFMKSAHRDSISSHLQETNFSLHQLQPTLESLNPGWNTCCAMVSHRHPTVLQSRVQLSSLNCDYKHLIRA